MAGALALATGSLVGAGLPATANIAIGPMLHSKFVSARQPFTQPQCESLFTVPCYVPAQVQTAYDEQPLFNAGITGAGQTIVILDAFGSPTIQADLATFDAHVQPACPSRPSRSSSRPGRFPPGTPITPT